MNEIAIVLRLSPHLLDEARRVAEAEGIALNQFIGASIAEKISALRTAEFFRERAARADIPRALDILPRALDILARAGRNDPPVPGDEIEPAPHR